MSPRKHTLFFSIPTLLAVSLMLGACSSADLPDEQTAEVSELDKQVSEQQTSEQQSEIEQQAPEEETPEQETLEQQAPEEAFDPDLINDPNSMWIVSNKLRPLEPIDFEPGDLVYPEGVTNSNGQPLREEAARAAERLVAAADADGVYVGMTSAYRSYYLQETLYYSYIERDGQELADRYSARPGHSEHQTGLTIDFDDFTGCGLNQCFENTAAGIWLQNHAHEHGFIMRYPDGYEHIVGFMYEPWHYRYVGLELASEMREAEVLTLEEWFDLPPAPDYLN